MDNLLTIANLKKQYGDKIVFDNVNATVKQGEVIAILGPSGAGKSTFLRAVNLLDSPTSGQITFEGSELTNLGENALNQLREKMGMVFQSFNLFPNLSVLENVKLAPMKVKGLADDAATQLAKQLLTQVGLSDKYYVYPTSLSGGQQQRVAIERAIVNRPSFIIADEPTGALDSKTSEGILTLFQQLNNEGVTIILVTHDEETIEYCNRLIKVRDGKILEEVLT